MWIWVTILLTIWSAISFTRANELNTASSMQIESGTNDDEYDSESARKIIGSR